MTPNQIRARLIEQGSSLRQFALQHGYEPRTVNQVVARHAGQQTLPNGRLAFEILSKLAANIGVTTTDVMPACQTEQTSHRTTISESVFVCYLLYGIYS